MICVGFVRVWQSCQNSERVIDHFFPIRRSGVSNRSRLGLGLALEMARGRKVPWHIAKTIASEVGIANARLQTQGVLSLMTLWEELAQLRKLASGQYLG